MELRTLLIGGIIPATLLGSGTVLMKMSLRSGISLPVYLMIVGGTVLLYGSAAAVFTSGRTLTPLGGAFALGMGAAWATAIFCMSYGISVLKLPVSVIAPLTNSNALIAVLLSSIVFAEWRELSLIKVLCGTVLIVAGATIVSTAVGKL
jgi:uncharacterized membrane protein